MKNLKKITAVLLSALTCVSLFGCGTESTKAPETTAPEATVESTEESTAESMQESTEETMEPAKEPIMEERFTEAPNYALAADATVDEIRATAVRAMYDLVTIPWYSRDGWDYTKSGVGSNKLWTYKPCATYGGLPYTNGSSGIFHWLAYYDYRNGELLPFDAALLADTLGNSCYSAVTWAWASVTNGIRWTTTHEMTPINGCPLVGDYDIGQVVASWKALPTTEIVKMNGEQRMYEAYALTLPADGMIVIPADDGNHIRMVCEAPTVVRNADGTINGEESYVRYFDQAMGHANETNKFIIDGKERWLAGHIYTKLSFKEWFNQGYVPITMDIFTGEQAYEAPLVTVEGADTCASTADFKTVKLHSVLRMAWVKLTVKDETGKTVAENCHLINRGETEQNRYCYNCSLSQIFKTADLKNLGLEKDKTYRFIFEAQDASGNYYSIMDKDITY